MSITRLAERTGEAIVTRAFLHNGKRWCAVDCPHCGYEHQHPLEQMESPGVRLAWCSPQNDLATYRITLPDSIRDREITIARKKGRQW